MAVMTHDHPQFGEFLMRLGGPGYCDFREDPKKGLTWDCAGGTDTTITRRLLADMGLAPAEIESSIAYLAARGGFCDCEIVLNCEPTTTDQEAQRVHD